jgi:hypothetical protein
MVAAFVTLCCLAIDTSAFVISFPVNTNNCVVCEDHGHCLLTVSCQNLLSLNFGQTLFMLCSSVFVKQDSFSMVTFKVPTQLVSTDFNMLTVQNYKICLYIACDHRRTTSLVSVATILCQNSQTG